MNERVIKDYYGRILGRIKEESNGNQVLTDYYGRILGRYEAKRDVTTDYYGRVIARGNFLTSLLNEGGNR